MTIQKKFVPIEPYTGKPLAEVKFGAQKEPTKAEIALTKLIEKSRNEAEA